MYGAVLAHIHFQIGFVWYGSCTRYRNRTDVGDRDDMVDACTALFSYVLTQLFRS